MPSATTDSELKAQTLQRARGRRFGVLRSASARSGGTGAIERAGPGALERGRDSAFSHRAGAAAAPAKDGKFGGRQSRLPNFQSFAGGILRERHRQVGGNTRGSSDERRFKILLEEALTRT